MAISKKQRKKAPTAKKTKTKKNPNPGLKATCYV